MQPSSAFSWNGSSPRLHGREAGIELQWPHCSIRSSKVQRRARKIGIRRAGETVSPLFLSFGFPLRLQVSLLFFNIETKAAVRDAAGSWKLDV